MRTGGDQLNSIRKAFGLRAHKFGEGMGWRRSAALVTIMALALSTLLPDVARADYTASNLPSWAIGPFTRYSGNPILSPTGSGFDGADLFNPGVINHDGAWQMLYRGQSVDGGPSQIGYASSSDGYHWTRYGSSPVISNSDPSEQGGVEDPRLYYWNGLYYSFYTAYSGTSTNIAEATSHDGIHWTQISTDVESDTKDASVVTDPTDTPVMINGHFVMYYGQSSGSGTFIAYSTDMVHWTTGTPINVHYPSVAYPFELCVAVTNYQTVAGGPVNQNIVLFAAGQLNGQGKFFYGISELEMSRSDPTQVLHQLSDAALSPAEPYELNGQTPKTVWMNSITFYQGQWWMYYGAGDRYTALATAPLRTAPSPPQPPTFFSTSFETGQPLPDWIDEVDPNYPGGGISGVGGICCGLPGPESSMRTEAARTGSVSLLYSGAATGSGSHYAYTRVFDLSDSPITVDSKLNLYYQIYPLGSSFSGVTGSNSTCVSLDLIFSDGTTLSSLGPKDAKGNTLSPSGQCGRLTTGLWNQVSSEIGAVAAGKKIVRIDVGYNQPNGSGGYRGYIDDIALSDSATDPWTPQGVITSISPSKARPGQTVTVTGSGFAATEPANGLYFSDGGVNWGQAGNGATFKIDNWSPTQITFTVPEPSGAGGQWHVTPGTTAYICLSANCSVSGGAVQPPVSGFTNQSLPILESDSMLEHFGPHVGLAPGADMTCGGNVPETLDGTNGGSGNFLNADALASSPARLTPGGTYHSTSSGLTYIWPNAQPCNEDNISPMASEQTILFAPNHGETASTTTRIGFLGLGAGGATSGPVTIAYADGSTSKQTLDFGDWCQSTPSDQYLVASVARTDGKTCSVFEKVIAVTAGKAVSSITLPSLSDNGNHDWMRIFAISLAVGNASFPQLDWVQPQGISYGTKLSAAQLDATSGGVAGTFSYSKNPAGTLLHVGANQPLSGTFTATGTTASDWAAGQTISTTISVSQYQCQLTWPKPAALVYNPLGIGLGAAQLDASANCAGQFDYLPNFGTELSVGNNELLCATFHPTDQTDDVDNEKICTTIDVKPYPPSLTWDTPRAISYGTPLSVIQLDPISDVIGTWTFSPPTGSVLTPGKHQLSATFNPQDPVDYVPGESIKTAITVDKAPLKITPLSQRLDFTDVLPDLSSPANWKARGLVHGDTTSALSSQPVCSVTKHVTDSRGRIKVKPGTYTIGCRGAAAANYTITYGTGKLSVLREDTGLVYAGPARFKRSSNAKLSALLLIDSTANQGVPAQKVKLGFKNGSSCTAVTNSAGLAACSAKAPAAAGTATVTASFAGTPYYLPATKNAQVKETS